MENSKNNSKEKNTPSTNGLGPPYYPGSTLIPQLPYTLPPRPRPSKKVCFVVTLYLHISIHLGR